MNADEKKAYNREYQRKRRLDPAYRERQRLYLAERRKDPAVREWNRLYLQQRREDARYVQAQKKYREEKAARKAKRANLDKLFGAGPLTLE